MPAIAMYLSHPGLASEACREGTRGEGRRNASLADGWFPHRVSELFTLLIGWPTQ